MRKAIFWLHLVAGVVAGIVILVMSVTGVLLMYEKQIIAWADGRTVAPAAGAERLPIDELFAKVKAVEPKPPQSVTVSSDPNLAVNFSYGRERSLFIDPYTGAVVSEGAPKVRRFFQSMIDWHRWLSMAGDKRPIGKAITGACNLAFLFLVVSGFYLWWPRSWNMKTFKAAAKFDFSLSGKARDWNWHNVAGFWMAIPLFFVVSTATFFSYPWATTLLYRVTGHEAPPRPTPPPAQASSLKKTEPPELADFNRPWETASKYVAGWNTIMLRTPANVDAPLTFVIDRGHGARPDLRSQISVNWKTGEITKTEEYGDYNAPRKIRAWVRWVHTGEAGGIVGQTIAGVASGAGALLVWTGISLALRRFFKRKGAVQSA